MKQGDCYLGRYESDEDDSVRYNLFKVLAVNESAAECEVEAVFSNWSEEDQDGDVSSDFDNHMPFGAFDRLLQVPESVFKGVAEILNEEFDAEKSFAYIDGQCREMFPESSKKELIGDASLDTVRQFGYQEAKDMIEIWQSRHDDEPEEWPVDKNGNPEPKAFVRFLNADLWETGFEYFEETEPYASIMEEYGQDAVGSAYMEGAEKFIKEYSGNPFQ